MIGSPDVLAFTGAEGFGEGGEEQEGAGVLPEELTVPLLPAARPWSSSARFNRDFILVAEFSEQVGPKPVLTIPDDQRVIGSFDLNHFSVRIMSVDYQASGPGHAPPSSHGPQLNFSEDSRVVLGDSAEHAFAYVQHLTLYDLEARGMVRPFCMAYVCSNQDKLMENFAELSTCFTQASDSLKTGNRQAFSMELQRKLQELESKRLTLQQETEDQRTVEEFTKVDELEAVERSIFNHRDLLRQVTSYPNRKLKQPDFLPYDPADSLMDPPSLLNPEPVLSSSSSSSLSSSYKADYRLKSLQELSNSYFLSLMKEQLADTERRLRGDRSILRTARITHSLSRRLTLTNFLFELWSPEEEEEEQEEKDGRERGLSVMAGTKQPVPPEGFQSEPPVLESFFSCVEELPIKLEAGEAGTDDPCAEAEMTGSLSSGDSIEVLGTEKSYRTQHVVAVSDSRETPVGVMDLYTRRPAADLGFRRIRTYAKRANSEDSIEVLSTTESIIPDDLTAITEEEAEHQALSNGFQAAEELQGGSGSDPEPAEEKTFNKLSIFGEHKAALKEDQVCISQVKNLEEAADINTDVTVDYTLMIAAKASEENKNTNQVPEESFPERTQRVPQVEEAVESTSSLEIQKKKIHSIPDLLINFAPPLPMMEVDQWSPPRTLMRLLSIDEASDCASFTTSSDPSSSSSNQSVSGYVQPDRRRKRRKAGLRALRFIKQNSFSQHAVYCLLSGRPLVIIGGDENLVKKLVDALSLFLPAPGPDGSAVMPCLTTPLQLTDLLTWRLIGIHRSPSNSSSTIVHSLTRYSRYLALLDLDQKTLQSPSYSGSLLGRFVDPHSAISRGITYLLHLESCLTALANQVLLYTFKPASKPRDVAGRGEEKEEDSQSDKRVMNFLSDLIKQHHTARGPPILRFSYCSLLLHRNTFVS